MVQIDKERMMRDIGKLFYGKNEATFLMDKFMKSITEAPVIKTRLLEGNADE